MTEWYDAIVKEFIPGLSPLFIVADPDMLLVEERIQKVINEREFELFSLEDRVSFRFAYESRFRSSEDKSSENGVAVILRFTGSDFQTLPYDLLQAGKKFSFSLADIFPHFSYPVVSAIDRNHLDLLYSAQRQYNPGNLGDNATKDFILRHVFSIAPEFIKSPADLLKTLLKFHYHSKHLPPVLEERFIEILRSGPKFMGWPLELIVPDRNNFFAFLQERWRFFVDSYVRHMSIQSRAGSLIEKLSEDSADSTDYRYPGPMFLPLDHQDIHIYMDDLFDERLLQPISHEKADILASTWVSAGIKNEPSSDHRRRLEALCKSVNDTLPSQEARYGEWFHFAYRWAELSTVYGEITDNLSHIERIKEQVDVRFLEWLMQWYHGLYNLPPNPPVMVHHLPRHLASSLVNSASGKARQALLVLDGMALDQWLIIRDVLNTQQPHFTFDESALFAWAPTITSVSRQAALAGKPPFFFPSSIIDTARESLLWGQFWADQGLKPREVAFLKNITSLTQLDEGLSHPSVYAAAFIIDKVDKITHGMELGTAGMHNQVRQWARQGFLSNFLEYLLERNFQVTIISDHGNIEATGWGRPKEGVLADIKGERVRVFTDRRLRDTIKARFPEAIEWPSTGLPDNFLPLCAPSRKAFINTGDKAVTHGGVSLEELIVPFVHVGRRSL